MTGIDWFVMAAYFGAVLGIGAYIGRSQRGAADYFLGRHRLPWWAVMLSIVATETSALTVISVPGIAARGDLTFLQVPIGYLIGRIGVALWLLPGYFRGEQETAYQRLEERFGRPTRRTASAVFLVIRSLGDSVRVFATAIPLALVTGWSPALAVTVVAVVTVIYTWSGGIRAVVWVDVLQLGLYVVAGAAAIAVASSITGLGNAFEAASAAGKLQTFDLSLSLSTPYTLFGGLIGGALLSAASHGTDHLIVQRLLATRSLSDARKAIVGSGIVVIGQFALFLIVGTLIWAVGAADPALAGDELFPRFVIEYLPSGLSGLVVAGILAAAMSTVSSSLNSLASASTHDFYASITGRDDPDHLLRIGRAFTVLWAVVLSLGALSFGSSDQPVVVLALSVASITYGGLLGTYILGGLSPRTRQPEVITAIVATSLTMLVVVIGRPGPLESLAWPWYVPLGTGLTLATAWLVGTVRRTLAR